MLRLLLVGAFPYPHDQGSQVYFQEQAIALRRAGAEVELLTYGPIGRGSGVEIAPAGRLEPDSNRGSRASAGAGEPAPDPDRWRALDGFVHHSIPAWARPATGRSGPNRSKALADLALAASLRRALSAQAGASAPASDRVSMRVSSIASKDASWVASAPASSRRATRVDPHGSRGFDAILAHHVEAAALALLTLPRSRPPIVFCLHTLLEHELPFYLKSPQEKDFPAGSRARPQSSEERTGTRPRPGIGAQALTEMGARLERAIAHRSQGWIALTQSAERVMSQVHSAHDSGFPTGARIAPPLPDPRLNPCWPDPAALVRAKGLEPNGFFLYAGNLDSYQDLPLLHELARARAVRAGPSGEMPIVVATHDSRARAIPPTDGVRVVRLDRAVALQALIAGARATLVPRRALGGFPIKLANSLALGTPAVALHGDEWGLVDGRDALIADAARPVASFAGALDRLERDEDLLARLRAGARATWAEQHAPEQVAAKTLALLDRVLET